MLLYDLFATRVHLNKLAAIIDFVAVDDKFFAFLLVDFMDLLGSFVLG